MNDAQLVADLQRALPDFAVGSWKLLGEGWMSRALLLNGAWVARFAKSEAAGLDLRKEARVLPLIAERVSLSVPRFEHVGEQRSGLPFVVYRAVPGQPLVDGLAGLPATTCERMAQQLARFMEQLQSVPVAEVTASGLEPTDLGAELAQAREAWVAAKSEIPPGPFDYVARRFDAYLAEPRFRTREPRLIHADLSPDHWLYDAERAELSGIIDFGDCELGDPDYEYLYLLEDAGYDFTRRVLELRGVRDVEKLMGKLRYLVTFDHAQTVLSAGRYGKPDWRKESLAALDMERRGAR